MFVFLVYFLIYSTCVKLTQKFGWTIWDA